MQQPEPADITNAGDFKVGDRVVVNSKWICGALVDEPGVVVNIDHGTIFPLVIQLDSINYSAMEKAGRLGHVCYADELRPE